MNTVMKIFSYLSTIFSADLGYSAATPEMVKKDVIKKFLLALSILGIILIFS